MALRKKKDEAATDKTDAAEFQTEVSPDAGISENGEPASFCVYIGPSIRGVINPVRFMTETKIGESVSAPP